MKNKKSITHKVLDNIIGFIFNKSERLFWSFREKIASWICPENDSFHYHGKCICETYCYEHERKEILGCSVCGIIEYNYKDYTIKDLENFFFSVKNGFIRYNDEWSYYNDEHKYLA